MIDTPFETWCASVARLMHATRGLDENAVDYLARVFGLEQASEAFAHELTPEQFVAVAVRCEP